MNGTIFCCSNNAGADKTKIYQSFILENQNGMKENNVVQKQGRTRTQ